SLARAPRGARLPAAVAQARDDLAAARAARGLGHGARPKITVALVPPKPKLFDSARSTRFSRAWFGTTSRSHSGSGVSRLIVGGRMPRWTVSAVNAVSMPPAAPSV